MSHIISVDTSEQVVNDTECTRVEIDMRRTDFDAAVAAVVARIDASETTPVTEPIMRDCGLDELLEELATRVIAARS